MLREMAKRITAAGVKPELECFEIGHVALATRLWKEGLLEDPPFYQFALGIPWGATADAATVQAMLPQMAPGANWAAFGISKHQMPMVAQSVCLGGHVRVGLEDNNRAPDGSIATNVDLVKHVVEVAEAMGRRIATPAEAREILSMDPKHKDRIMPQLDVNCDLKDFVSDWTPYEHLEKAPAPSLEYLPKSSHENFDAAFKADDWLART